MANAVLRGSSSIGSTQVPSIAADDGPSPLAQADCSYASEQLLQHRTKRIQKRAPSSRRNSNATSLIASRGRAVGYSDPNQEIDSFRVAGDSTRTRNQGCHHPFTPTDFPIAKPMAHSSNPERMPVTSPIKKLKCIISLRNLSPNRNTSPPMTISPLERS